MTEGLRFELLIFDWEGTINNGLGQVTLAFEKAAEALSFVPIEQERLFAHLGMDIGRLVSFLYPDASLVESEKFIELYHRNLYEIDQGAKLFAGMKELLSSLHAKGVALAILTCKGRSGLDRDLQGLNLESLFFASRTPNECLSKPNPEGIIELMDLSAVSAEKTAMIGDSTSDMEAAKRAEISAIGVDFMSNSQDERLFQAGASMVFKSVGALSEYLLSK